MPPRRMDKMSTKKQEALEELTKTAEGLLARLRSSPFLTEQMQEALELTEQMQEALELLEARKEALKMNHELLRQLNALNECYQDSAIVAEPVEQVHVEGVGWIRKEAAEQIAALRRGIARASWIDPGNSRPHISMLIDDYNRQIDAIINKEKP